MGMYTTNPSGAKISFNNPSYDNLSLALSKTPKGA